MFTPWFPPQTMLHIRVYLSYGAYWLESVDMEFGSTSDNGAGRQTKDSTLKRVRMVTSDDLYIHGGRPPQPPTPQLPDRKLREKTTKLRSETTPECRLDPT